jgi:hypothetical protein
MPSCLVFRPKERHAGRTAQRRQTALAALTWSSAGPFAEMGKKSSGSSRWQAPSAIQPQEPTGHLMAAWQAFRESAQVPQAGGPGAWGRDAAGPGRAQAEETDKSPWCPAERLCRRERPGSDHARLTRRAPGSR